GSCTGDPFLMAGAPCDDDNPCTANDVCVAGTCTGDPEPEETFCDDGNPCTADDACRQGSCEGVPLEDGTRCNDDNPCTGNDVCDTSASCLHLPGNEGTMCRPAAGDCDAAESCSGSSASCPPDRWKPAGIQCRAAAGPCDEAELCTGQSRECPADGLKPSTVV